MIQEFTIENYLSIRDSQTLSFKAGREMTYRDILTQEMEDGTALVKFAALYGANASGKTNILNGLAFLRDIALIDKKDKSSPTDFIPFLFDEAHAHSPGHFELVFYTSTGKFSYTVTLDNSIIFEEKLSLFKSGKRLDVYSRVYDEKKKISQISFFENCGLEKAEQDVLRAHVILNTTVLAAYRSLNVDAPVLNAVVEYFQNYILPEISPTTELDDWTTRELEKSQCERDFLVSVLKQADFKITDIDIKNESLEITKDMIEKLGKEGASPLLLDYIRKEKKVDVKSVGLMHSSSSGNYRLDWNLESHGTRRYFGLGGVLNLLLNQNHFLCVDELETSLHPHLVNHFIKTFLMNGSQFSQLLVTTHDIDLLEADFMRKDMVWFCERDEDGASSYYAASDFKLHKNISLANFYKLGKLGAVPSLGSVMLDRKNEETIE